MLIKDPHYTDTEALESAYAVTCDALNKAQSTVYRRASLLQIHLP